MLRGASSASIATHRSQHRMPPPLPSSSAAISTSTVASAFASAPVCLDVDLEVDQASERRGRHCYDTFFNMNKNERTNVLTSWMILSAIT
jgi:hypothetical protein